MTSKLDSRDSGVSVGDRRRSRAYLKEFVPAIALYCVMILVTVGFIGNETATERALFVNLNMIPIMFGAWAIVRHVRRIDEFERLATLHAMAASFGVAMLTSLVCALAASAKMSISPLLAAWAPFLTGMVTWALLSVRHIGR